LEAQLAGALVLQADASDAHPGNFGVVRALSLQLVEKAPDLARKAAKARLGVLAHVLPELLACEPELVPEPIDEPQQLVRRVLPELREWMLEVSRKKTLLLAVDDVHLIDEPSASFLALLAQETQQHGIVIAATITEAALAVGTVSAALGLLSEASVPIVLSALSAGDTEQLLGSLFGDVPNLQLVAHHLYDITRGNPRAILRLAQHLVDRNVVRYQAGSWSVPGHIDAADLPSSMAQALKATVDALSDEARALARTMSLEASLRLRFEECLLLTEHRQPARLLGNLDELVATEVVRVAGPHYGLGQQGFVTALGDGISAEQRATAHRRLSELFELRGDGFRVAQHLVRAGDIDPGLDTLIAHAELSQQQTDANPQAYFQLLQSLPDDWFTFYELALRLSEERKRPNRQLYQIRARLAGLMAMSLINADGSAHMSALVEQLRRDVGLDIYAALPDSVPAGERLSRMFQEASGRYATSSEDERVLDPMAAMRQLARAMIQAIGLIAFTNDYPFWKRLPDLTPLVPLSPALGVVQLLSEGLGARISGRADRALELYTRLLERISQPDGAGLDASHQLHTKLRVTGSLGTHEAWMGRSSSCKWADELQSHPLYESSGLLVRMLYHLWQGDVQEAERCKRQVEMLQVQNASRQAFDGTYLLGEIAAHAFADDLTRVKRTTNVIEL
ncbi:MAG TPA: hypothetical protein VK524_24375, partial [Polyangiaceae bacterium]|nr:hypothetical protein [Polyangiaceae bacterium]